MSVLLCAALLLLAGTCTTQKRTPQTSCSQSHPSLAAHLPTYLPQQSACPLCRCGSCSCLTASIHTGLCSPLEVATLRRRPFLLLVLLPQWTATDVQAATQQLFASITSFHPTEGLKERRAALVLLLQLWAAGHPLPQCRSGASGLLQTLPQLWPADAAKDPWGLESDSKAPTEVCAVVGQAAPSPAPYVACKGSSPESRGFTCGLWLLFHTTAARWVASGVGEKRRRGRSVYHSLCILVVALQRSAPNSQLFKSSLPLFHILAPAVLLCCRLPEKDGGALLVSALKGFAQHFFQCEVCRCAARQWGSIQQQPS